MLALTSALNSASAFPCSAGQVISTLTLLAADLSKCIQFAWQIFPTHIYDLCLVYFGVQWNKSLKTWKEILNSSISFLFFPVIVPQFLNWFKFNNKVLWWVTFDESYFSFCCVSKQSQGFFFVINSNKCFHSLLLYWPLVWSRLLESTVIWIPGCCWLCWCVNGRFWALLAGAIAITVFVWLNQHSVLRSTGVRQDGVVLGGENRAWSRRVGRHLCDQQVPGLNVSVQSHFF